jgi:predicted ATPase
VMPFVLSAARARPVLLVLDDVHWADRASLALLRQLARSINDTSVLILGTFREQEAVAGHPLAELLPMLRREAPFLHVALRELSVEEASSLIAQTLELEASELDDRSQQREGRLRARTGSSFLTAP